MFTFERMSMPLSYNLADADDFHPDEVTALEIYDGIKHHDIPDDIPHDWDGLYRQMMLLEKFDDQTCFIGRDDEGNICAVASVDELRRDGTLWVNGIAVDPEYRLQGVGHEFVQYLEELAKKRKMNRLGGRAVAGFLGFHLSEGFYVADNDPEIPLVYKDL